MKAAIALILLALGAFFLYEVFTGDAPTFFQKFQAGVNAVTPQQTSGAGGTFGTPTKPKQTSGAGGTFS